MFNLQNLKNIKISPKVLGIILLVVCLLSSLNIIIYNEETLIALSFILFVVFVFHYFGSTLKSSLDERGESIKTECQNFLHYKQQSLSELSAEHGKIAQLETALSQLMHFVKNTTGQLTSTGKHTLQLTFSQQMHQKCNELRVSQLPQNLQSLMAKNQEQLVLARCAKQASNNLSNTVLKNAIQLLSQSVSQRKNK